MITKSELKELRDELLSSKKPILFFDDDNDGLCSFLLYYRFLKDHTDEIKGIILKTSPELDGEIFVRKVDEFNPDKIFVLDKAMISQGFLDSVHRKVIWLDHHPLVDRKHVTYYNPLKHKSKKFLEDNRPTSYWAYKTIEKDRPQDMWIAAVGVVSDWHIPDFLKKFLQKYPDMLPEGFKFTNPGDILYGGTRLGELCRIIYFNLKFASNDAMVSAKILSRIDDPYEILDQTTPQGKYIYKQYKKFNSIYQRIKSDLKLDDTRLVLFEYSDQYSITSELSNELIYAYPDKLVVIARKKNDSMICSFRGANLNVRGILEKALVGINGSGGGHEHACGGNIPVEDWPRFLENLRRELTSHTV
jgi:oligoribonuclease NrnB/cAMP/cGMP phosphodiesterase (DHH superfamily)